jgi:hypothetical protein
MKRKLIYRCSVKWGWLILLVTALVFFLTVIYIYYLGKLVIFVIRNPVMITKLIVVVTAIPLVVLNILFFPVMRTLFLKFMKKEKYDLQIYNTGFKIRDTFLEWKKIKSISFHTGRLQGKTAFFYGYKLPIMQKIFLLDKEGNEYSCVIDIDYYLKKDRDKNNLRKIRELLLGLDKVSLISDWAEKR